MSALLISQGVKNVSFMCVIWTKEISFDNLTHVVFWTKVELFYKNPLKSSLLKSQFQNPRNLDEEIYYLLYV